MSTKIRMLFPFLSLLWLVGCTPVVSEQLQATAGPSPTSVMAPNALLDAVAQLEAEEDTLYSDVLRNYNAFLNSDLVPDPTKTILAQQLVEVEAMATSFAQPYATVPPNHCWDCDMATMEAIGNLTRTPAVIDLTPPFGLINEGADVEFSPSPGIIFVTNAWRGHVENNVLLVQVGKHVPMSHEADLYYGVVHVITTPNDSTAMTFERYLTEEQIGALRIEEVADNRYVVMTGVDNGQLYHFDLVTRTFIGRTQPKKTPTPSLSLTVDPGGCHCPPGQNCPDVSICGLDE